jgi:F-type H+-transporting ATPase subunit delta
MQRQATGCKSTDGMSFDSLRRADPLDAFSPEAIRSHLAEAQRVASGNGTEEEKAEAAIEVQVYEALQAAIKA